jgi:hypothetical protein
MTLSGQTAPPRQGQQTTADSLTATQLFAECLAKEQKISVIGVNARLTEILKEKLLTRPLFVDSIAGEYEPLRRKIEARYPYDFSIIKPKHLACPEAEWRREQISERLKRFSRVEFRLLLIARWLAEAGICNAEDVLQKSVLDSLIDKFKKTRGISPTVVYHTRLIKNWVPYFDRLWTDFETRKKLNRVREELVKLGHDPKAVAVTNRRSRLEAIYKWLGDRKGITPANLRNSYSHMRPHDQDL